MKDEPVDILDKNGNKTGQVLMKSQVHKDGLWHGGAHLWIYNDKGQVLLQKRAPNKVVWPNIWDVAVAGHIAAGDTAKKAVMAEAQEELGIKVNPKEVLYFGEFQFADEMPDDWTHRVFVWSYVTKANLDIKDLILEKAETSDVRWISIVELERELADPINVKNNFSPRGPKLFNAAIREIRKRQS